MNSIFRNMKIDILSNKPLFIKIWSISSSTKTAAMIQEKEKDHPVKNAKNCTIRSIQNIFNLSYRNALKIINNNIKLTQRNGTFLSDNHRLLMENGVHVDTILKYPQLLGIPFLNEAIHDLKTLPYTLDTTIVLACLVKPKFDRLINHFKMGDNKIDFISKLVKVPPDIACEFLYKKDFLISKDPKVLTITLKLILDFGITLEEVHKDLWVLKHSNAVVEERIKLIQENYIEIKPKPWMIRSPVKVIENYARRRTDNKQILGSDSFNEYLSKKLLCSEEQARHLVVKLPALRTKSLKTLSDMINFLYSKGFCAQHIYRVPKILVHSVETMRNRLEQLQKAGVQVDSLYVLTKSQKQFYQYIEMKKSK